MNRPAYRLLIAAALALPCWAGGCLPTVAPGPGAMAPASRWERSGRGGWLYSSGDLRARVRWVAFAREYRWEVYDAKRPNRFLDRSEDSRLDLEEAKEQAEVAVMKLSYGTAIQ